jgi:hypothetical protein
LKAAAERRQASKQMSVVAVWEAVCILNLWKADPLLSHWAGPRHACRFLHHLQRQSNKGITGSYSSRIFARPAATPVQFRTVSVHNSGKIAIQARL